RYHDLFSICSESRARCAREMRGLPRPACRRTVASAYCRRFGLMEGIGMHMANWCATAVPGLINSINTNIHVCVCTRLFDVAYLLGVNAGP
ncbi:hypothetical protein BJV77DRAFT_999877, partial [Russula vinacea]